MAWRQHGGCPLLIAFLVLPRRHARLAPLSLSFSPALVSIEWETEKNMYSQRQSSRANRGWKERRSGIEEGRKKGKRKERKGGKKETDVRTASNWHFLWVNRARKKTMEERCLSVSSPFPTSVFHRYKSGIDDDASVARKSSSTFV